MFDTKKPFDLYVIESESGRRYVGISSDVKKRLEAHNAGLSRWTRGCKNWKLIYTEQYPTYADARKREIYLKSLKGGNAFLKIIHSGVEQPGSSRGS